MHLLVKVFLGRATDSVREGGAEVVSARLRVFLVALAPLEGLVSLLVVVLGLEEGRCRAGPGIPGRAPGQTASSPTSATLCCSLAPSARRTTRPRIISRAIFAMLALIAWFQPHFIAINVWWQYFAAVSLFGLANN